ncbi:MAG: DUF2231 domain-containing protein [Candidatus Neomarinimicrobiota bacterium]
MTGFESVVNLHPLWVHFPIAITILALIFEGLGRLGRQEFATGVASALIYSAAISAMVTLVTGFMAADSIGHDSPGHDLVHQHRDIMISYTVIIVALALANLFISKRAGEYFAIIWIKTLRPLILVAAVAVLSLGADKGAELVFRYGLGARQATAIQSDDTPALLPSGQADSTGAIAPHDDGHDHVH